MGIIHKLTQEIADFILFQKKQYPGLSCRKIESLVKEVFDIKLSKSSINSFLKENDLSSPVGRRSSGRKKTKKTPRKFRIPEEKKQHLFKSASVGEKLPQEESPVKKVQVLKKKEKVRPPFEDFFPVKKEKKPVVQKEDISKILPGEKEETDKTTEMSKKKKGVPKKIVSPFSVETKNQQKEGVFLEGMGCVFFKAAQWALSSKPVLGSFLKEQMGQQQSFDFDMVAEILPFMALFKVKELQNLPEEVKYGLGALSRIEQGIGVLAFQSAVRMMSQREFFGLVFELYLDQIFFDLKRIEILLENGERISVDAQMLSLNSENVQSEISAPMNQVIICVTQQILLNVQSAIMCSLSADKNIGFSKNVQSWMAAFNNLPGRRISKVVLYDKEDKEVVDFDAILQKKRLWIAGVWPWQDGFVSLVAASEKQADQIFVLQWQGQEYLCRETYTRLTNIYPGSVNPGGEDDVVLRAFSLQRRIDGVSQVVIVTNAQKDEKSTQETIFSYLLRWPNLEKGPGAKFLRSGSHNPRDTVQQDDFKGSLKDSWPTQTDMWLAMEKFTLKLTRYCQKTFFPSLTGRQDEVFSSMRSLCALPGYLLTNDRIIKVSLFVPPGTPVPHEIIQATVSIVNESGICDYHGRQLVLSIC